MGTALTRVQLRARAAGALYLAVKRGALAGRPTAWCGELGPLTSAERDSVRKFVADIITWECSMPADLSGLREAA